MPQPVPNPGHQIFDLQITEQFLCFILFYSFLYIQNLSSYSLCSELDLDNIACFLHLRMP